MENRKFRISGELYDYFTDKRQGNDYSSSLRKKYNLEEGEVLTVIDLGEGTILLKPMMSQVKKLSRQIDKRLKEENISLDDLLQTLDEERKTYYKKQYAKK